ncbi:hypothetical protein PF004_g9426 [Phytophthora fragariae]|uniref:Uncharacterized protein n=1 Tax=Phytophthora fragariae TaxID=53985 RepID=A0A6A3LMB6_9STRA|nr:hypothetical protein PF011_g6770 [Phytophthora fragariae]KAE9234288.1 hypothetical protein PF004_g9426 [Phytophthora fragariae]
MNRAAARRSSRLRDRGHHAAHVRRAALNQVLTPAQVNELRVVDCSLLEDVVEAGYTQHVFAVGQLMTVRCDGLSLCLQCMDIGTVDGDSSSSARIGSYLHMSSFICFASLQLVFCKTINVDLVCPCYYLAFLNTACLFILFA